MATPGIRRRDQAKDQARCRSSRRAQRCQAAAVLAVFAVFALLRASAATAAPPQAAPLRAVAVLPLHGVGVLQADRDRLEDELRTALRGVDLRVEDRAGTASALEDVRALGLDCDFGSVECLVRVGALALTHLVLAGSVSATPDGFELELQLVDVIAMQERGRQRVPVAAAGARRPRDIESALTAVLRPEAWRGELVVEVPGRTAASVALDGVPRGLTPLKGAIALSPGSHELFVGLDGFRAHRETVVVRFGEVTRVKVELVPGVSEPVPMVRLPTPAAAELQAVADAARGLAPTERRAPLRVAFYDVETLGVDARLGRVLGLYLSAELRKRERVSLIDSQEIRALTGGAAKGPSAPERCDIESCFAEVAEALGADAVVVTQLTQTEGRIVFGLRRIDQRRQEVVASFVETVPVDEIDALLPLVGRSIEATFGDIALRQGRSAGVDAGAARALRPPPLPPAVAVATAAVAGVGAAASAVLALVTIEAAASHDSLVGTLGAAGSPHAEEEHRDIAPLSDRYHATLPVLVGVAVATAVIGAGAGVLSVFTDWQGDGDLTEERR